MVVPEGRELRMTRQLLIATLLCLSTPALAASDELEPVPAQTVMGQPYAGDAAPSKIRFINVRNRPVRLMWIGFDGARKPYALIAPGQEIVQPTYVANRWLVEDAGDGQPLEAFISTRSASRDNGAAQIALIR
jgi:hypothetical protein